eukprot:scaffold15407_cov62-Phaeocystis_antarctica.AAC.2
MLAKAEYIAFTARLQVVELLLRRWLPWWGSRFGARGGYILLSAETNQLSSRAQKDALHDAVHEI